VDTKEKLLGSLKEILNEALEFNRAETRLAAEDDYIEEVITVRSVGRWSGALSRTDAF
jgi:hypothetical protein